MAGTLDQPSGLATALHICVEDAGDYYRIPRDAPHQKGPRTADSIVKP